MFTIPPQIRETYFRKSYDRFKTSASVLAQTDYERFSGISDFSGISRTLDDLTDSFEDRRGVYIYLSELGDLVTLDCWLRTMDFSKPFYIGGTISYHC